MSDCRLILRFTRQPKAELYRIEFADELGTAVHAFRGKSDGVHSGQPTFQWTTAVRGLASLAIRAKLAGSEFAILSGERGSPAAALDFALGKPPRWISELFSHRGQRHLRYFRRSNPELKQPGPVEIAFNPSYLDGTGVDVQIADRSITSHDELSALLESIDPTYQRERAAGSDLRAELVTESTGDPRHESAVDLRAYLTRIFAEEALHSLARIRVSSPGWCRSQLTSLSEDSLFQKITVNPSAVAASLTPPLRSKERFGLANDRPIAELFPQPIRVLATNCQPGFISIVVYLRDHCNLPLIIDPLHLYGVELRRRVLAEGESDIPTIMSLGLGPSSTFLNDRKHGYSPLMLGPALNHRVVSSNGGADPQTKPVRELLMVAEEITSAMFSLASFQRSSPTYRHSSLRHVEPDEVTEYLARGEQLHSLLWFPHNRFFPELLGGQSYATARDEPYVDITMLLGNTALTSNPPAVQALLGAIRHAWLSLLEQPATLREIASRVIGDDRFYSYTRRALGLHNLAAMLPGAASMIRLPQHLAQVSGP